jgi:hypothetical protein
MRLNHRNDKKANLDRQSSRKLHSSPKGVFGRGALGLTLVVAIQELPKPDNSLIWLRERVFPPFKTLLCAMRVVDRAESA